jgi:putative metallohydrolase (TIGR04338 family)
MELERILSLQDRTARAVARGESDRMVIPVVRVTDTPKPKRRPRDQQRARVYRAEGLAAKRLGPSTERLETIEQVQDYVNRLMGTEWLRRSYNPRPSFITVTDGRGRRSACAMGSNRICMPRWSRSELVILHEVAHCLLTADYHRRRVCGDHGWRFAEIFLALVRNRMGVEAERVLREEFRRARVRYTEPRIISDEERRKMAERFLAAKARWQAAGIYNPAQAAAKRKEDA